MKAVPESKETPEMESKSHSKRFLQKAARMAGKKRGKRGSKRA